MWVQIPLDTEVTGGFRSLMVEHMAVNHAGVGSNPTESLFFKFKKFKNFYLLSFYNEFFFYNSNKSLVFFNKP